MNIQNYKINHFINKFFNLKRPQNSAQLLRYSFQDYFSSISSKKENKPKEYITNNNIYYNFNLYNSFRGINYSYKKYRYRKKLITFQLNQLFLRFFIFISLMKYIITENTENSYINNITSRNNIIYLTIIGNRKQKIINESYIPDIIYLNGIEIISDDGYISIDNKKINNVTLVYSNSFKTLDYMFSSIRNILEIDLSNFDTSNITSMVSTFETCTNLKYINFNNINTSLVTDMTTMFKGCQSLTSIDLSNFDTSKVASMAEMFNGCLLLTSLNLLYFNTPELEDMYAMFCQCKSLKNIDLSNFETSNVRDMAYLFTNCISLTSINLSNFDTSNVFYMYSMFENCKSLTSINLSNFDTSNVKDMDTMFLFCSNLINLDLSNFDTFQVTSMEFMFYDCISLISLDISNFIYEGNMKSMFCGCNSLENIILTNSLFIPNNANGVFYDCHSLISIDLSYFDFSICEDISFLFYECMSLVQVDLSYIDTSSVTNMMYMFYGCYLLSSLDLSFFDTFNIKNIDSMFFGCSSLTYLDLSYFDTSLVTNMKNLFTNCIKLSSINLNNLNTSSAIDMQSMFYGCISLLSLNLSSFDTSLVNNMKSMFFGCSKLTSLDLSNFNFEKVFSMNTMLSGCKKLEFINFYNYNDNFKHNIKDIFYDSNENLILFINNKSNTNNIKNELTSSQCITYNSSFIFENRRKIINDSRICIDDCMNDPIFKYEYENICYKECPLESHSLINGSYICEKNEMDCIENYPFLDLRDKTCVDVCNSKDFFNKKCSINKDKKEIREKLISNIINGIEDGSMDKLLFDVINGKNDLIIKEADTYYQITTSSNQNINKYLNISSIYLGELEKEIKEKYNISQKESLIIFKIDKKSEDMLIPIIQYEIFNPITRERLDLNFNEIKGKMIEIYIPVIINESEEYKYNRESSYYNDICESISIDGIDLTLYDRQNEFYKNNMSLCQAFCIYIRYDHINKKSICQCEINYLLLLNNTDNIEKQYIKKKSLTNLKILKCLKLIFSKNNLIKNIGSYFILIIIILFIISSVLFYSKGYDYLCNQINELLNSNTSDYEFELSKKKESKKEYLEKNTENMLDLVSFSKQSKETNNKNISEMQPNLDITLSKYSINNEPKKNNKIRNNDKKMDYIDYEINNFSYEEAKENDKRTYCEYYLSLLKTNHILLFVFNRKQDYNSNIVKICILFFSFTVYLFINCLFFNDSLMHKIYEDKGSFNLIYNMPSILYSTIISTIIIVIIKKLSLSHNEILEVKHETNKYKIKSKSIIILKCLIIKYIIFFIAGIVCLLFFWLYLSSFCILYKNTQTYLFINTLISYLISIVYSFIIYLIPSILRICALKGRPGKCLYNISQIIQLF